MNKIMILMNSDVGLFNFRMELLIELKQLNNNIVIVGPKGKFYEEFVKQGFEYLEVKINRRGTNPISDIILLKKFKKIIKHKNPDIILTYTIKPNIYGGIASNKNKIPFIANITGLGSSLEKENIMQKIILFLYKKSFKNSNHVFFQNLDNKNFFIKNGVKLNSYSLLPGSGVNLEKYIYSEYYNDNKVKFVFIGRIMKEKGINYYLESAKYIKSKYNNTEFHIIGPMEDEYTKIIQELVDKGIVIYHGEVKDIRPILKQMHCTVHPTYYPEGMSNVLLESAAMGKPIIGTNRSGVKEIIDNNINGYLIEPKNQVELNKAIEKFLKLTFIEKKEMGLNGRKKIEIEFDRNIVVNEYIKIINNILGKDV